MILKLLLSLIWVLNTQSILIPVEPNIERCMTLLTFYEMMHLQVKFPPIPNKQPGDNYRLILMDFDQKVILEDVVPEDTLYRKSIKVTTQSLCQVCFELESRTADQTVFLSYFAVEDFNSMIRAPINIPAQFGNDTNLGKLYFLAKKGTIINQQILKMQRKEMELEDSLVNVDLSQEKKIVTITIIECIIILISGIYQLYTLKKFIADRIV